MKSSMAFSSVVESAGDAHCQKASLPAQSRIFPNPFCVQVRVHPQCIPSSSRPCVVHGSRTPGFKYRKRNETYIMGLRVVVRLRNWPLQCRRSEDPVYVYMPELHTVHFTWDLTTDADTEIDWKAYMQQVNQYIGGERDYIKIYGDTGPLVYPAAHVYIYRLLYYFTDEGRDIRLAQNIFIALYLAALLLVFQCYRKAGAPPYVFPMLVLSRRLHSIFLLRLFNDGFAVFFLFLAIFCYQRRWWTLGSVAFSTGLGVKMSLLLALPAIGVVLWQGMGRDRAMRQAMIMGQLQVCL